MNYTEEELVGIRQELMKARPAWGGKIIDAWGEYYHQEDGSRFLIEYVLIDWGGKVEPTSVRAWQHPETCPNAKYDDMPVFTIHSCCPNSREYNASRRVFFMNDKPERHIRMPWKLKQVVT